jgi:hypothetical protein
MTTSAFDQLDFVLGALVLVAPRATPSLWDFVIVVALSFGGHILHQSLGVMVRHPPREVMMGEEAHVGGSFRILRRACDRPEG